MARPRKFLQQDAEHRYYLQVYPLDGGPSKRLRLNTKDRNRASDVAEVIRPAWMRGDYNESLQRRNRLNEAYDRAYHEFQRVRTEYFRIDDPGGYAEETAEIEQADRISDQYDRPISEALLGLHSENLHHDIAFHVQRALDYLKWAERKDLLTTINNSIRSHLGESTTRVKEELPKASEHRVSDCLSVWTQRAKARKQSAKHIRHYERLFTAFASRIGNCSVNRLSKKDIVGWQDHIDETRGERGPRWHKEQLLPIPAVFKVAMLRTDWDFPDGLRGWLEVFEYDSHKPQREHSQPISLTDYEQLLAKATEWAAIDVDNYARSLPMNGANVGMVKKNNVKQAKRIKRAGTMWSAILKLAVNCGCDNADIVNVTVDDLRMGEALPLFALTRNKTKTDRLTPLLPSTVDAIKLWQAYETAKSERVFSNDAKRPFSSEKVSEGFDRLREACGLPKGEKGVWFKHLRNTGPTIAKRNRRATDEREAFLGHTIRGMCRFYEGDVGDDYLVDLVNLIGAEYFDGEKVA